jgi:hypothetical protein
MMMIRPRFPAAALALGALLLVLPAAAAAQGRDHGRGHHASHGAKTLAFAHQLQASAAQMCKAERQAKGTHDFNDQWGTNPNGANALGKCVSQSVKVGKGSRLSEFVFGTISSFGAAGCNTSAAGCALAASGSIEGRPIAHGTFTAALTVLWTSATSNGDGGYCAPASGTGTLSDGTNTLTETIQGTLCEIGATGTNVGHAFSGRYTVSSGSGTYANTQGAGRLGFYQPTGTSTIAGLEHGSLSTGA